MLYNIKINKYHLTSISLSAINWKMISFEQLSWIPTTSKGKNSQTSTTTKKLQEKNNLSSKILWIACLVIKIKGVVRTISHNNRIIGILINPIIKKVILLATRIHIISRDQIILLIIKVMGIIVISKSQILNKIGVIISKDLHNIIDHKKKRHNNFMIGQKIKVLTHLTQIRIEVWIRNLMWRVRSLPKLSLQSTFRKKGRWISWKI